MTVGQMDRHTDRIDHLTPCTYTTWGNNNNYYYEDSASMPLSGSLPYRLSLAIWKVFVVTKTVDIKSYEQRNVQFVMEMMDVAIDLSVCTPALN